MTKTGLVLEGGGFRGIYTAGVLDVYDMGVKDAKAAVPALRVWLEKGE